MTNIEDTISKLDTKVSGARPNMDVSKKMIYSNEKTGTIVYNILTDNASLIRKLGFGEHIVWGQFLAGNQKEYAESDCYVASEARFRLGQITENDHEVRISRIGTETIHFGIQCKVGDIVLEKSRFRPY